MRNSRNHSAQGAEHLQPASRPRVPYLTQRGSGLLRAVCAERQLLFARRGAAWKAERRRDLGERCPTQALAQHR